MEEERKAESTMFLFIDSQRERAAVAAWRRRENGKTYTETCWLKSLGELELNHCHSVPFVCKSWYKATLVPKCWETLVFPYAYDFYDFYDYINENFGSRWIEFVKSAVGSQGTATHIGFEYYCPNGLVYISEKCSELKSLYLCDFVDCALICDLICKWKKLEFLHFSDTLYFTRMLESISLHCKNFVGLSYSYSYICEADSAAIVEFIPKIKSLKMSGTKLPRDCLVQILKGCRELDFLDVSDCVGFDDHDTEILELASHIRSFNCDGSVFDDPNIYDVDVNDYPLDEHPFG